MIYLRERQETTSESSSNALIQKKLADPSVTMQVVPEPGTAREAWTRSFEADWLSPSGPVGPYPPAMPRVTSLLYFIVGLINFAPIVGLLGAARREALYGTAIPGGDLLLLLRHRAVLLALVGGLLFYATAFPQARPLAAAAAFVSMLSFIALAALAPLPGDSLVRVAWIDVAACVLLAIAVFLERGR